MTGVKVRIVMNRYTTTYGSKTTTTIITLITHDLYE